MSTLFGLVLLLSACLGGSWAHIHSQKYHHLPQRDSVAPSIWVYSLLSAVLVGACGVFPLVVNRWVHLDSGCKDSLAMRAVLSFAVGGLLGDVFLHLLPEAWGHPPGPERAVSAGLWVLAGLLAFMAVEKMVNTTELRDSCTTSTTLAQTVPHPVSNGNGTCYDKAIVEPPNTMKPSATGAWGVEVSGYLNLVANCTDNFTHGLAIAASYLASPTVGLLTTAAILCHEMPHEVGDFAILLNSGFDCRGAAKAQLVTACGGVVGVLAGLTAEHMTSSTHWLLPFTAGGFLYIALVSILPDLLEPPDTRHCIAGAACLLCGVGVMALVTIVEQTTCSHVPT